MGCSDPLGIVNIYIGGFGDKYGRIVKSYFDRLKGKGLLMPGDQYFSWTAGKDIIAYIKNLPPAGEVNLIGHSYGGDTAANIAKNAEKPGGCGRKINLLITIDPVGHFAVKLASENQSAIDYKDIRNAVIQWVNVNAGNDSLWMDISNWAAFFGGKWGDGPKIFSHIYSEAYVTHKEFKKMMAGLLPDKETPETMLRAKQTLNPGEETA